MSQNTIARPGHVEIHLSEDMMTATVDFYPPAPGGDAFTISSVISELGTAGVVFGINEKVLEQVILKCLREEQVVKGVVVAKGKKAEKTVPSYWHLKKRLLNLPDDDSKVSNVDYKERTPYVLVKQGEPLAKKVPESPGKTGKNLAGDILPITEKDIVAYKPAENIIEKDEVLYAACHGRFEIKEREMSVNETLDIGGNVDYSTGHIAFPGDVIIHGAVCDGFRVAAGKSIFVKQTMDASQVLAKGNLVVEGGIKGRGEAQIRIDGSVSAKFIENATIEVHGDIVVAKSVMHSDVHTLSHVDLSEAGVLIGGEIWAKKGMRVGNIGRPESPSARIFIGSDYLVDRKLRHTHEHIDRLEAKLEKLKAKTTINAERDTLIQQVEDVLEKMRLSEKEFNDKRHPCRKAKLIVFGQADVGTEIIIGGLSYRLSKSEEKVVFYYDPDGPRIATRAVTEADKAALDTLCDEDESDDEGSSGSEKSKNEQAASDEVTDKSSAEKDNADPSVSEDTATDNANGES